MLNETVGRITFNNNYHNWAFEKLKKLIKMEKEKKKKAVVSKEEVLYDECNDDITRAM
jgi:hypothetical protein